jgi:hypothetical protein
LHVPTAPSAPHAPTGGFGAFPTSPSAFPTAPTNAPPSAPATPSRSVASSLGETATSTLLSPRPAMNSERGTLLADYFQREFAEGEARSQREQTDRENRRATMERLYSTVPEVGSGEVGSVNAPEPSNQATQPSNQFAYSANGSATGIGASSIGTNSTGNVHSLVNQAPPANSSAPAFPGNGQ